MALVVDTAEICRRGSWRSPGGCARQTRAAALVLGLRRWITRREQRHPLLGIGSVGELAATYRTRVASGPDGQAGSDCRSGNDLAEPAHGRAMARGAERLRAIRRRFALLTLTDFTTPFESVGAAQGELLTLTIDVAYRGLPVDVVRHAAPRIASSPLNKLVVRHLLDLGPPSWPGPCSPRRPDPAGSADRPGTSRYGHGSPCSYQPIWPIRS
jgi:hypothetical protein